MYILVNGNITITAARADDAGKETNEINKKVIFKNCAPFTKCISKRKNTQVDDAQEIDVVCQCII